MSNDINTIKLLVNNKIDVIIERCDVVKEHANILVSTANS